jgi:UDP-N-acetylmuramoylalanine--D-glutamate ligase
MKTAIVGYGIEGIASAKYWHQNGHDVTVCDQNAKLDVPSEYAKQLGKTYLLELDKFDVIVRSAGIHPRSISADNPSVSDKITTNVQEFFKTCPSKNIIGVTGTKGKGTTSTLIAKMLESAGYKVHLGGNIGVAPLEMLSKISPDDWVVMELSSFQLEDFRGPSPHIAVCLMVVPEHLNWHANMEEYVTAKSQLFAHQSKEDIAIFFNENDNSKSIAAHSPGTKLTYFQRPGAIIENDAVVIDQRVICTTKDIMLKGQHNWQNVCAAVTAVWQITQDEAAIKSVISSFSGLEHRLEFIKRIDDVSYYDDSFATTPETAIAALEAFAEPKIVILGGSDKGISLEPLTDAVVNNNVKHVIAIGDTGPTIAKRLKDKGFDDVRLGLTDMASIINQARSRAEPGDVVLLSTGCASFGLFKDYKDRGNQFRAAVQELY